MSRQLAVAVLRARFLSSDRNSQRPINDRNGGGNLVHILTARPTGARKMLCEIVGAQSKFS